MWRDRTFRASVLASIVAAIIMMVALEPAIRAAWNIAIRFSGGIVRLAVDAAYQNAALGNRNWVVALFAMMFCFCAACIALGASLASSSFAARLRGHLRRRVDLMTPRMIERRRRSIRTMGTVLTLAGAIIFVYEGASIFIDLQLNASFDQRLTVLAAAVPEATVKKFRADWAQMKSRQDYLVINQELELLASNNIIVLPKPLLR